MLGLAFMTSCEEEEVVLLTDAERIVGTWLYEDPSASGPYEIKQQRFTFNANNSGTYVMVYGDNSRVDYPIQMWTLDEENAALKFMFTDSEGEEYYFNRAYRFDEDVLLLDLLEDGAMCILERQGK